MYERIRNVVDPLVFLVVLGLLWEWSVHYFGIKAYLFPP